MIVNQNQTARVVPFNYHDRQVRTVEIDGETWFVAQDVCDVLGIQNARQAVSNLEEDEATVYTLYTPSRGNVAMNIISESGLYFLVLRSNKPEARPFQRWVTKEVLPTIRKTGSYTAPQPLPLTGSELVPIVQCSGTTYWHGMTIKRLLGMSTRTAWSCARKNYGACFHKSPFDGAQYITFDYAKLLIDGKALRDAQAKLKARCLHEAQRQMRLNLRNPNCLDCRGSGYYIVNDQLGTREDCTACVGY